MPRPTILAFNAEALLPRLRFLCMKLGVLVQPVPPEDFSQPISALCGLAERTEAPTPAAAFPETMIVFCHMNNAQVNRFIQLSRQQRFPAIPLKAVLTPTNAQWSPMQLIEELKAERQALQNAGNAPDAAAIHQK